MEDLLLRVRRFAQRYGLWAAGEAVVVGVSGGPDSLCLLHLLRRLAPDLRLKLHIAHLNHGLRGAEADADADMVAGLAASWHLPCTLGRANVAALADRPGVSLEEAARQARYGFLVRTALAVGAHTVAVGHNADDQAETVLMHFLRGSGLAGLRGMLPRTRLSEYRLEQQDDALPPAWLVRPLLTIPRTEIEAYCVEHDLHPHFDRSNEDRTFFRNRLRHELLPILEQYNPGIRDVLCHTATVVTGDYEVLAEDTRAAWERVYLPQGDPWAERAADAAPDELSLDLAIWRGLPLGLQRATLRSAIQTLRRSLRNVNWEHVEAAVWIAREGQTGQAATLVAGLEMQIHYTTLRIVPEGTTGIPQAPQVTEVASLAAPGITRLPNGWQVSVRRLAGAEVPANYGAALGPWIAYLDGEATGPHLVLRPRHVGERFRPQGLGGHTTSIGEFMIDAKVPREARPGWPVLEGRDGVAWLCGLRVDERCAVRPGTNVVWEVHFTQTV